MTGINSPSGGNFPACPFALLPAASAAGAGAIFRATDVGANGSLVISTGTNWRPLNGVATLGVGGTPAGHTGDTLEVTLATVAVPPMSANGQLRIVALYYSTGSGGNKGVNIRHSAASGGTAGTSYNTNVLGTGATIFQLYAGIRNIGSVSSQAAYYNFTGTTFGSTGVGPTTGSINTASPSYINFNINLNSSADTGTLEAYSVEWLEP